MEKYNVLLSVINSCTAKLASIKPISSEHRIEWTGLIGAGQQWLTERKFNKVFNTIIIENVNYLNFPKYLIDRAKDIKCELDGFDPIGENVEDLAERAIEAINDSFIKWEIVCPELTTSFVDNDICEAKLPYNIFTLKRLCDIFVTYPLRNDLKEILTKKLSDIDSQIEQITHPRESNESNSGCFGVLLFLLIPAAIASYLVL